MRLKLLMLLLLGGLCFLGFQTTVSAQSSAKILPDKVKYKTVKKDGWYPDLKLGFNFSFAQSDGVVGVQDGTTLSLGLQLNGALTYAKRTHEWRTTISLVQTQTKLPTIEPFVKSADRLEIETGYVYRLPKTKWFGFFGSVKLDTPLLPGFLVKPDSVKLLIKEPGETAYKAFEEKSTLAAQEGLQLTGAFAPLTYKLSLGFDFLPIDKKILRLNFKVGAGLAQTFVQNGLRVDADKSAASQTIELGRLQDFLQVGSEARLLVSGKALKNSLKYSLTAGLMLPFYSSVTNDKSIPELLNFDMAFTLGIQVYQWLAINYALNVAYAPLIVPDKFQITNNLVVSITWDVF